jgi:murein DD-endopeptidase MepM/ murein hydrolase activator NlpD
VSDPVDLSRRALLGGAALLGAVGTIGVLETFSASPAVATPSWRHPFTARAWVPAGGEFGSTVLDTGEDREFKPHTGLDYNTLTGEGTPIYAVAAGTVTQISYSSSWGHFLYITHSGGYQSAYAHMVPGSPVYNVGDSVPASGFVGELGTSGGVPAHLHLVIKLNGGLVDPYPRVHNAPLAQPGVEGASTDLNEEEDMHIIYVSLVDSSSTNIYMLLPDGTYRIITRTEFYLRRKNPYDPEGSKKKVNEVDTATMNAILAQMTKLPDSLATY